MVVNDPGHMITRQTGAETIETSSRASRNSQMAGGPGWLGGISDIMPGDEVEPRSRPEAYTEVEMSGRTLT